MSGFDSISIEARRWIARALILCAVGLALGAPASTTSPADEGACYGELRRELDAIADLLIDGRDMEAKTRAVRLLENDSMPQEVVDRATTLLEKADARLIAARNGDGTATTGNGGEPDASRDDRNAGPAADRKPEGAPPEEPEAWLQSYRVRIGKLGEGFHDGDLGLLRIGKQRMLFIPWNRGGREWTVRWSEVAIVGRATGTWDVQYPIQIVETDGTKRFVARVDNRGAYIPTDSVLRVIDEARAGARREP